MHVQSRVQGDVNVKKPVCNNCKKPGHISSKCYRLIDFPKDFKFTKTQRNIAANVRTTNGSTLTAHAMNSTTNLSPLQRQ